MLRILDHNGFAVSNLKVDYPKPYQIIADEESEIKALTTPIVQGEISVIPEAGSTARVAGSTLIYEYSPSGKWVKVG